MSRISRPCHGTKRVKGAEPAARGSRGCGCYVLSPAQYSTSSFSYYRSNFQKGLCKHRGNKMMLDHEHSHLPSIPAGESRTQHPHTPVDPRRRHCVRHYHTASWPTSVFHLRPKARLQGVAGGRWQALGQPLPLPLRLGKIPGRQPGLSARAVAPIGLRAGLAALRRDEI